jgi:hypothetical protein
MTPHSPEAVAPERTLHPRTTSCCPYSQRKGRSMSRVVFRPERERSDERYFVGWRLAWLYPVGTVIESRGVQWVRVVPEHDDSFGWWERA